MMLSTVLYRLVGCAQNGATSQHTKSPGEETRPLTTTPPVAPVAPIIPTVIAIFSLKRRLTARQLVVVDYQYKINSFIFSLYPGNWYVIVMWWWLPEWSIYCSVEPTGSFQTMNHCEPLWVISMFIIVLLFSVSSECRRKSYLIGKHVKSGRDTMQ